MLKFYEVAPDVRGLRILNYGDTGTGKTSFAATAIQDEAMSPVLVANTDDGLTSVAHIKGLRAVNIHTIAELESLVSEFLKAPEDQHEMVRGVKTLIVDSISQLRDSVMDELVIKAYLEKPQQFDKYVAKVRDWGQATTAITRAVDAFRQLGLNLILTAGVHRLSNPITGLPVSVTPLLNPRLLQNIGHMMDAIWLSYKQNGRFYLQTIETGIEQVKSRNPKFVEALGQLSIERVVKTGAVVKDNPSREKGELAPEDVRGIFRFNTDEPALPILYNLYLQSTKG